MKIGPNLFNSLSKESEAAVKAGFSSGTSYGPALAVVNPIFMFLIDTIVFIKLVPMFPNKLPLTTQSLLMLITDQPESDLIGEKVNEYVNLLPAEYKEGDRYQKAMKRTKYVNQKLNFTSIYVKMKASRIIFRLLLTFIAIWIFKSDFSVLKRKA